MEKKLISVCLTYVVFPVMGTMRVAKISDNWRSYSIHSIFSAVLVPQLNSTFFGVASPSLRLQLIYNDDCKGKGAIWVGA